jgi:hypothetical protein
VRTSAPRPFSLRATAEEFDIILMSDLTKSGDLGFRIAEEARVQRGLGYRTGLIHLKAAQSADVISLDVQACIRDEAAVAIDPASSPRTRLLVVHSPDTTSLSAARHLRVRAERTVLVLHRPSEIECVGRYGLDADPSVSVAPVNRRMRAALEEVDLRLPIERENWRPAGHGWGTAIRRRGSLRRPSIGWIGGTDREAWPKSPAELSASLPADGSFDVFILGRPLQNVIPSQRPSAWGILDYDEIAVERFLQLVNAVVFFPGASKAEIPEAALSAALGSGKPVAMPFWLQPYFESGPIFCEVYEAVDRIRAALANPPRAPIEGSTGLTPRQPFSGRHRCSIERLIGAPAREPKQRKKRMRSKSPPARALFVASNGIGLGHVSRLLAIARRANERFEPVFVTLAQAIGCIQSFGFTAEYIASQAYVGADLSDWDQWFGVELAQLTDRYDARLVVFDGSNAPPGLIRATGRRSDCALAWIRRGMWGDAYTPLIENSRWFDLIIEPGEIAGERDFGATARRRHEAVLVKPIRLLDGGELLPKSEAMSALGLDEEAPAVLVQVGAGANRDIVSIVDEVVTALQRFPGVQIALAEWATAESLPLWPDVKVIRGFPLSQYFNAFDFSISAAGYNTFHETIAFELPTIFVPNASPGQDDQIARARFAQDNGAAFELPADGLSELPEICAALLDRKARDFLKANCRRLRQENGAQEAADALAELVTQ